MDIYRNAPPRDRLLRSAAAVWAADPSASLDVVAQAAGVGRATLHRHFASRADLMRLAALDGIAALAAALEAADLPSRPPAEALDVLIDVLVPFGERLHFLLVTGDLMGDPEVAAAEASVDAPIRRVLDAAAAAGVVRGAGPSAWRFRVLEALLYAAWTGVAAGELARLDAPGLVRDAFRRGFGVDAPGTPTETP
jgi:AcrR family transcriptional regulator